MPFNIDIVTWIFIISIFFVISIFLTPRMIGLQARMGLGQLRKSVRELEDWAKESKRVALRAITKHGKPRRDVEREFNNFLEFFAIAPVSEDPVGVLRRLEHVLDVRKKRFEGVVARLAPKAEPEVAANLEMTIEGAMASYSLYRLVRHFTLLAEKTKSYQLVMLLQMQLPFLKEYGKAFVDATKTFVAGKPIGDGVGAMTATQLIGKARCLEPVENTIYAETKFDGRKLLVVKAKGPGGRVGKPGELIKRLITQRKVSRIIMIDAALKLEGDVSGQVIEGVGAAIGGPPTEKYKIEETSVKRKVPLDAILIKESFKEAIRPLNKRLARAVDVAAERVKQAVRERTKPGDVVIVAGIGNTIGIGQRTEELPKEFPSPPEKKKDELESDFLPLR
ncbi:MAG: DUF1512 family protein [Hadesarchaea archaeon]|nr:DUF1512 family protein [Hadesarchaea archaeon]